MKLNFLKIIIFTSISVTNAYALPNKHLAFKKTTPPPTGAKNLCSKYSWACAYSGRKRPLNQNDFDYIQKINRQINNSTKSISDKSQYGVEEYWTLPSSRGGDCEDFALLKKQTLIRAGFNPESLLIMTAWLPKGDFHAVLVLHTDQGDYILDNLTNTMKHWSKVKYFFLKIQDSKSTKNWREVFYNNI